MISLLHRSPTSFHHALLALTADTPTSRAVRAHALRAGVDLQVKRFHRDDPNRRGRGAEIGTEVERIVKSLVFVSEGERVVSSAPAARV